DVGALHSDAAGCGTANLEETRLSWVIIQWKVKIYRRMRYGETITVKTWVPGTKRLYTFREYAFYDEAGELVAACSSKWVLTHLEKGMITVPPWILEQYGMHTETVFEEGINMARVKEPLEYSSENECTVPCTWIDVNGHMNNLHYLDVAYQALPIDLYLENSFNEFEIMYKREAKMFDRLHCYYQFDGTYHIVSIKNAEDGKLHAVVRFPAESLVPSGEE
ncbi:MAG: hypothetical protein IIY29_00405, partial [Firmicutes bacterium]|nr:hypothetical protein [Bacillota bacterium]